MITEHTNPLTPSTISTLMKIMIVGLSFFGDWSGFGLRSINGAKKLIWIELKRSHPERPVV